MTKRYLVQSYRRSQPEPETITTFANQDAAIQMAREYAHTRPDNSFLVHDTTTGKDIVSYPATRPENWHWEDPGEPYPGQPI